MNVVVVGIGSNLDPERNVRRLLGKVSEAFPHARFSSFRKTVAIGPPGRPDFLNGAFLFETDLTLQAVRQWLQGLEKELGRVRTADKFAPRTMDLDILLWNGELLDDDVKTRSFLLDSIRELIPAYRP